MAVLRRDTFAVEQILIRHPQLFAAERNVFGHSAIHLAIGWPDGLQLLLDAADEPLLHQQNGTTPLDYAIAFGCANSIRLLADADFAFDMQWNLFIGTDALDPEVSDAVLNVILKRLQQLLEFGKQNLPSETLSSLQINRPEWMHLKARALMDSLRSEGIQLPPKFARVSRAFGSCKYFGETRAPQDFWLQLGGFFHQYDISHETVLALFGAGITDVDAEVEQITPLMRLEVLGAKAIFPDQRSFINYYRNVEFFVQKGGRLDRQIPFDRINGSPLPSSASPNRYQVVHRIASGAWMRALSKSFTDAHEIVRLGSSQIWRSIFQSNVADPCICACATGGCRPISIALKSLLGLFIRDWDCMGLYQAYITDVGGLNWDKLLRRRHWKVAAGLLGKIAYFLGDLAGVQLVEDVIRFLTFSALGLTHTCCRHREDHHRDKFPGHKQIWVKIMDLGDVDEIRDEEAEMIEKLDSLVHRFVEEFWILDLPLSKFLQERWHKTMVEDLQAKKEATEAAKEQLKELGVTLKSNPDQEEESESDEESLGELPGFSSYREAVRMTKLEDDAYDEWVSGLQGSIRC